MKREFRMEEDFINLVWLSSCVFLLRIVESNI